MGIGAFGGSGIIGDERYCPQLKGKVITESSLEWVDTNSISPNLTEKSGDVFYKVTLKEMAEPIYIYVILEHKSSVEHDSVIQTMLYTFRIWEQEFKKSKESERKDYKLPTVIMILFYEGEDNWTASLDFRDKIKSFDGYDPFKLEMIDLKDIPEKDLIESKEAIDYFMLLRKPNVEDMSIREIVDLARKNLNDEEWATFVEFLYNKVDKELTGEEIEELRKDTKGGEKIMGILDKAFKNEREEGEKRGEIKGMLDIKFGEAGLSIMDRIMKIGDLSRLEKIKEAIRSANTIDDVLKYV